MKIIKNKKLYFIISIILVVSCKSHEKTFNHIKDNPELKEMVKVDQEIRMKENDAPYESIDQKHRLRVFEMLVNGEIKTIKDKENASLILQHTAATYCNDKLVSTSPENYYIAYTLAKSACGKCYLAAITLDRYLLFTEGKQKFGTQKEWSEKDNDFIWSPIDSLTTDKERKEYGVPTLKSLLKESRIKKITE